jgi:hypothetical protein
MAAPRRLTRALVPLASAGWVALSCAPWLEGCASPPPARHSPPAAPAAALSYDLGPLVPVPFGTAFKDVPGPLTEVLVFHSPDARRTGEDADCFRPGAAVSFLGRAPADHLLCFDHDRLQRIEASIVLPAAEAPALFAAACTDWQQGQPAPGPATCEGRQGDIAFSARRSGDPDGAGATLSITLTAVKAPP